MIDGGKMGNQVELLKPFTGKPKSVKTFTLWRDEDSLMQRQLRVRGSIGAWGHPKVLVGATGKGANILQS